MKTFTKLCKCIVFHISFKKLHLLLCEKIAFIFYICILDHRVPEKLFVCRKYCVLIREQQQTFALTAVNIKTECRYVCTTQMSF